MSEIQETGNNNDKYFLLKYNNLLLSYFIKRKWPVKKSIILEILSESGKHISEKEGLINFAEIEKVLNNNL